MHLKPSHLISAVLPLCVLAAMLAGCRVNISVGSGSYITGEDYPDARKYKTGAFTYAADEVKAVEVYWRSGEVALIESGASELSVSESGGELPEDTALHYLLDGVVPRIRFCGSGARILVNEADKRLRLEVPKGIDISVHTTSALLKADALEQDNILISAFSGRTELGTVTAENIDLSSSSGAIRAGSVAAQSVKCRSSSGSLGLGSVSAGTLDCGTSSGAVTVGNAAAETIRIATSSGRAELAFSEATSAEIHSSSGKIVLTLAGGGAELSYTSGSGKLFTERSFTRRGALYVFGSGECRLTVETSSGNLEIR